MGFSEKGSFQSEFVARLKLDLRERQVVYALRPAKINVTCPQALSRRPPDFFCFGCVFPKNLAARATDIHSLDSSRKTICTSAHSTHTKFEATYTAGVTHVCRVSASHTACCAGRYNAVAPRGRVCPTSKFVFVFRSRREEREKRERERERSGWHQTSQPVHTTSRQRRRCSLFVGADGDWRKKQIARGRRGRRGGTF